jgi:F-type H+-transporting ATPase subunit epsilon
VADGVFGVEVVTPEQPLVAGGATAVILQSSDGELTVLDGHTALVSDVAICEVRIEQPEGVVLHLAVHGGFMEVDTSAGAAEGFAEGDGPLPGLSTKVTILAGVAELSTEIDVPRARAAKESAEQQLNELRSTRGNASDLGDAADPADLPLIEAERALARAELRLEVAGSAE